MLMYCYRINHHCSFNSIIFNYYYLLYVYKNIFLDAEVMGIVTSADKQTSIVLQRNLPKTWVLFLADSIHSFKR